MSDASFGGGQAIADLWGSNAAPKAVANRFAEPAMFAGIKLAKQTVKDINPAAKMAFDKYMSGQGRAEGFAGEHEGVLRSLLAKRQSFDPNQQLQETGRTAFGFIDPNVVSPLARFDVNYDTLARRAKGLNPAAVDSTAEKIRNARIASGRYYDVARDVYNRLPELNAQAYNQRIGNEAAIAGTVPQIAGAWESVLSRPTQAIRDRITTAGGGVNLARQGVDLAQAGTQGYKQDRNFADRLGAAITHIGEATGQNLDQATAPIAGSM